MHCSHHRCGSIGMQCLATHCLPWDAPPCILSKADGNIREGERGRAVLYIRARRLQEAQKISRGMDLKRDRGPSDLNRGPAAERIAAELLAEEEKNKAKKEKAAAKKKEKKAKKKKTAEPVVPQYVTAEEEAEQAKMEAAETELARLRIEVCSSACPVSQYARHASVKFYWPHHGNHAHMQYTRNSFEKIELEPCGSPPFLLPLFKSIPEPLQERIALSPEA